MGRGKSVVKLLLDSSEAALFAGIEIHNKPHITYRYPTSVILIINAWELALKAFVYKFIGKKKVYEGKDGHTIAFSKAMDFTEQHINAKKYDKKFPQYNDFSATKANLELLNDYRCSNIHFYESNLDPLIFTLISKAVINYDEFIRLYFKKDITRSDNLMILPVGFKLPLDPIKYLKQAYGKVHNDFVNTVIQTIRQLTKDGIKESIVIGFDMYTVSRKKIENADIVAAIDQLNGTITLNRLYTPTDDINAPTVRIAETSLRLTYQDVLEKVQVKRPDIKRTKKFHKAMEKVKQIPSLCQMNYLNPITKEGSKKPFFAEVAVDKLIEFYDEEVSQ